MTTQQIDDEMLTFSIDPDYLPTCPYDGTRTVFVRHGETVDESIEECPHCKRVMRFVVEEDDD